MAQWARHGAVWGLALLAGAAAAEEAAESSESVELMWNRHDSGDIILDTKIRDWVLIPIFIIMMFFTMLREYGGRLMNATAKADVTTVKQTQALQRAQLIRTNGGWIPEAGWNRRRAYYADKDKGVFADTTVSKVEKDPIAMMSDPNMMMQQQKSMFTVMLPQMVMMGVISYFFSGFVMVKIPFPLSLKFKSMTQRGIELATLDVTFVSSFSWYVLVSVGISGVMSLILGRPSTVNDATAMQQQMNMQQGGQPLDTPKLYAAELENLNMSEHKWNVDKAESRLIAMYGIENPS